MAPCNGTRQFRMPDLFQTLRMELLFPALPVAQRFYRLTRIHQSCRTSGYVDNLKKFLLRTLHLAGYLNRIIDVERYILLEVSVSCYAKPMYVPADPLP